MINSYSYSMEAGIDEAGRGALCGRVYAAAVILPPTYNDDTYELIKDSKKISKKNRKILKEYIENVALAYAVEYSEVEEIDDINILQATINAMHKALDKLTIQPQHIIVDGTYFHKYKNIEHKVIKKGDSIYRNIAAASILAKVYHDEYILNLLKSFPNLETYGLQSNMGYGTKKHILAIKKNGPTPFHRKSFKTFNL